MEKKSALFRAKRIDWENFPKEHWWVCGNVIEDGVTGKTYIHLRGNEVNESDKANEEGCLAFVAIEVIPETLSSFTGKMQEGQELFENHILVDDEEGDIVHVRWDEESCAFVLDFYGIAGMLTESGWDETAGGFKCYDTYEFTNFSSLDFLRLIGNSFDNHEFLEGKYYGMLSEY